MLQSIHSEGAAVRAACPADRYFKVVPGFNQKGVHAPILCFWGDAAGSVQSTRMRFMLREVLISFYNCTKQYPMFFQASWRLGTVTGKGHEMPVDNYWGFRFWISRALGLGQRLLQ